MRSIAVLHDMQSIGIAPFFALNIMQSSNFPHPFSLNIRELSTCFFGPFCHRCKMNHHKGSYPIRNGSDHEAGGIRRGPRRLTAAERLRAFAKKKATDLAVSFVEKKVSKALRKRSSGPRSHHKGYYKVLNGSDHEKGGVRRGPRRGKRGN